jgi:hypothetical protein
MPKPKRVKLRLTLDVTYMAHDPEEDLGDCLRFVVDYGANNGLFSGNLKSEVETWDTKVEKVEEV